MDQEQQDNLARILGFDPNDPVNGLKSTESSPTGKKLSRLQNTSLAIGMDVEEIREQFYNRLNGITQYLDVDNLFSISDEGRGTVTRNYWRAINTGGVLGLANGISIGRLYINIMAQSLLQAKELVKKVKL